MAGSTFKTLAKAHDAATVAPGSALLTADRVVAATGILTIAVCLDTSTPVQLSVSAISDDTAGTVVELLDLNGGAALTAGQPYVFTWVVSKGETILLLNKSTGSTSRIRSAKLVVETPIG